MKELMVEKKEEGMEMKRRFMRMGIGSGNGDDVSISRHEKRKTRAYVRIRD